MAGEISRICIVGNCQAAEIAKCLQVMLPGHEVMSAHVGNVKAGKTDLLPLIAGSQAVLAQPASLRRAQIAIREAGISPQVQLFPEIFFTGFHPDLVYGRSDQGEVYSPIGNYNSAICLYGWLNGFTEEQVLSLYNADAFEALGYDQHMQASKDALLASARECGLDLSQNLVAWSRRGCFMHTVSHPDIAVMADITRALLARIGMEPQVRYPEYYLPDFFSTLAIWPLYPEIAQALGIQGGDYFFKAKTGNAGMKLISLESFVAGSFANYAKLDKSRVTCARFDDERYALLKDMVGEPGSAPRSNARRQKTTNPYAGLPDFQFWKKSVVRDELTSVDPVVNAKFAIRRDTKVATAGSCFAQHIAKALSQSDNDYFVVEKGSELGASEASRRNYGVFSARYGNIYTARQLNQLMDRAYGRFDPVATSWKTGEGRHVDPFRPQIEPDGFASQQDMLDERARHLGQVRNLFESLDVLVFTLGLTEAWFSKSDGAVYPLAPGVAGGKFDPASHEFVNFSVAEVVKDLEEFLEKLRAVNPAAKVILTVSPVPLIATYEKRHVLVSTTYSKSVLRVAAEEAARNRDWVDYFPSYEIITGNYTRGAYFDADLRSVKPEGVAHVMSKFLLHYCNTTAAATPAQAPNASLVRELIEGREIVCDEERIADGV